MLKEKLNSIFKEVPECLGVGVYNYIEEKAVIVVTHLPDYNPDKAAKAYSLAINEIDAELLYFPKKIIGPLESLIISAEKTKVIIYKIEDTEYILAAAIPSLGNLALLDITLRKIIPQIKKVIMSKK